MSLTVVHVVSTVAVACASGFCPSRPIKVGQSPENTPQPILNIVLYRFAEPLDRTEEDQSLQLESRTPTRQRSHGEANGREMAHAIITLQEGIEYFEHEFLTSHFFVTHHGGCVALFNEDTFHSDIKVTSAHGQSATP